MSRLGTDDGCIEKGLAMQRVTKIDPTDWVSVRDHCGYLRGLLADMDLSALYGEPENYQRKKSRLLGQLKFLPDTIVKHD